LARRIARERNRSRAAWRRSSDTPRLWDAPFLRPRPTHITSEFGSGRVFNGRLQSRHMGTDFEGSIGDPVRAANRGIVSLVGNFYYAGRLVYIDHGRGLLTAYLHLSQINVSEGDLVERGQVIGHVGSTGRVTGPHLHWIARVGAVTANPMSLLELAADGFAEVTPPGRSR
jgi:murein DD-endopeptidase MepM/ murein hydrolase activator NlpD